MSQSQSQRPSNLHPEVINGTTPLENRLLGVHPRLFLTSDSLARLQGKLDREPYARLFTIMRKAADQAVGQPCPSKGDPASLDRGHGCTMPHLALAWLLTREARYLDSAAHYIRAASTHDSWGPSLIYGHVSFGMSLAYDWLHKDLDEETRAICREALLARAQEIAYAIGTHQGWLASVYACNHFPVTVAGVLVAGAALYGEAESTAPLLRFSMEKFRLMTDSLGPDGVSQEGLCYGEYYADFLFKGLVLVRDLLDLDLFRACEWLRQTPLFYLYSSLPRKSWTAQSSIMRFGDGVRYHWYGPDVQLRRIASEYRDPLAQWLADETLSSGISANSSTYLGLLWYDPTVPARPPAGLPTLKHFTDKDLVFMRSGWNGSENACAFKCGAPFGRHALERYSHDIGGGHMCPDAGAFQIFAFGDWLITDDGYQAKWTDQQNTVLVNGVGQTGEGGDWFESSQTRTEKRAPHILRADSCDSFDYVIGDVCPAYEKAAGLKKFLRHFLYVKPAAWIITDELETEAPSTFELFLHSDAPFSGAGRVFELSGTHARLRVTSLWPDRTFVRAFRQDLRPISNQAQRTLEALIIWNAEKSSRAVFVTVLEACPADHGLPARPSLDTSGKHLRVNVQGEGRLLSWWFRPGQADPASPALTSAGAGD